MGGLTVRGDRFAPPTNEASMKKVTRATAILGVVALAASLSVSYAGAATKKQTLTVWTWKQSEVPALKKAGAAWGAKNNATVKVSVYTPDASYQTAIQAAAKSHTLPDILSVWSQGYEWTLAEAGITRDLTADFPASWRNTFLPGIISGITLTASRIANSGDDPVTTIKHLKAGHFYEVPILAGTPGVVFARKSVLKKAGVNADVPPATWQEWVKQMTATKTADPTNGGLVTGLQVAETGYFWLYRPMAYAFLGKDAFYARQGKTQTPSWDSAQSIQSLNLYDQLTPVWAPGSLALGIDQADQAFAAGKAAWDVGGTFTLSSLAAFGLDSKDISVFPIPAATGGVYSKVAYTASPLIGAAITSQSKNYKLALSFLKYLTGVEGASTFAATALDLPATSLPLSALPNPLLKQLVGLMSTAATASIAFSPNDFSADPNAVGIPVGHDTAVGLTKLVDKSQSVADLAKALAEEYKTAWAASK